MTYVTELHLGDAKVEDLSVEQDWMNIFSPKTRSGEIKHPELQKCISLIFSWPFSKVQATRLFDLPKLIKTDIRNSVKNVTLVSRIKVSYWLKNEDKISSTVSILKAVSGFKTKANATCDEVLETHNYTF